MKKLFAGFGLASLTFLLATPAFAAAAEGDTENLFAGDIGSAIWTVVIFLLVIFVLGKFAWGPVLSQLQAREDFIREALSSAKADREAAEARLREYEEKLAAARAEATAIVEEGRRDAEVLRDRLEADGQKKSDEMLARAKREIEIATQTAVKEIYQRASQLTTDAASRIIRQELKPEDHQRLIAEAIERIEGESMGAGKAGTAGQAPS